MALLCGKIEIYNGKKRIFLLEITFEHRAKKAHEHAGLQSFFKTVTLI